MNPELKEVLSKTVAMAKAKGAECDVILSRGESFSASAQGGTIDKYKLSGSQILGVRTIKDQHVGISYTENFEDDAIINMLDMALETSRFTDTNEFESIVGEKVEHLYDEKEKNQNIDMNEKLDFCLKLESEVKEKDERVQAVPYSGFGEGSSESYYLNSKGTFGFESDSSLSCYTSALISDGKESSMHYHSSLSRNFKNLDKDACIKESLEHASMWLNAKPAKTGNYDIVFNHDSLSSLLGCFSGMFSAKGAWEKTNPFSDKLNTKIAVDDLSIIDMPNFKNSFYRYRFDSEGNPYENLTLIQNGELNSFYHNSATAKYFKTKNTGHAARGAKGSLGVSGTNLVIQAGSESSPLNGDYIEICTMQGLHSGANSISGDFSFGASGYICNDGKRVTPIKGITVAGNFYTMLKEIKCIGNNIIADDNNTFFAPTIRFSQLSVAGQ